MAAMFHFGAQAPVSYCEDTSLTTTRTLSLSLLGLIVDETHALHWAANHGCRPLVLHLTKSRPRLKARTDSQGQIPLHLAAAAGHVGLIPHLITPAILNAQDSNSKTALQLAVRHQQLEAAAALLAAGASLGEFETAAHTLTSALWKSMDGSLPELPLLLLNAMLANPGAAVQVAQALQWPHGSLRDALHLAAKSGSQELVVQLLEAGADKDAAEWEGATPLALAAKAGHVHLVPLLATPTNINPVAGGLVHGSPLFLAAQAGKRKAAAALLKAGAQAHTCSDSSTNALAVAAEGGHTSTVLVLLRALLRESQQQQEGQEQEQGQEQQQGQAWLVSQVAAAVRSVLKLFTPVDLCTQLLEVVLDVLGPQVTGEVCHAVQQQLQQAPSNPQQQLQQAFGNLEQQPAAGGAGAGPSLAHEHHFTQFAEALLVAWMGVEERLHAGRQPVLARLQRLVPGVGDGRLQQQQQQQQEVFKEKLGERLVQLVEHAESAAAAGQEQRAHVLLQEFAALFHQRQQEVSSRCASSHSSGSQMVIQGVFGNPSSMFIRPGLTHASHGRKIAAMMNQLRSRGTSAPHSPAPLWQAQALHPPAVYTTFLAAWVGARRRLQQLPREMVTTVVVAVQAAQQQQQVQEEAKEAAGAAAASGQRQHQPVATPRRQAWHQPLHQWWRQPQPQPLQPQHLGQQPQQHQRRGKPVAPPPQHQQQQLQRQRRGKRGRWRGGVSEDTCADAGGV